MKSKLNKLNEVFSTVKVMSSEEVKNITGGHGASGSRLVVASVVATKAA